MTEQKRDTILGIDDRLVWRQSIQIIVQKYDPEIKVRLESTKEAALAAIDENADRLLAVITDNHLDGDVGASGEEIASHALEANIPHVAILTGKPNAVSPQEGIDILQKATFDEEALEVLLKTG